MNPGWRLGTKPQNTGMMLCRRYHLGLTVLVMVALYRTVTSSSLINDKTFCDACCQGPGGVPGIPGVPGEHGEDGAQGKRGPKGEPGNNGQKGDQGPRGDEGVIGDIGGKGDKGFFGKLGPIGRQGNTGPKGFTGEQGETGSKGDRGDRGEIGPTGSEGERGMQGLQGIKGKRGTAGERGLKGNKGKQGTRGFVGPKGPAGPQGVGIQGPKGNTGSRGYKGRAGLPAPELTQCAFMAHCFISSGDLIQGRNEILPFDELVTNVGDNFDLSRGKFVAPIPGTYVFHFTTDFDMGRLKLVKNGETQLIAKRFSSTVIELQTYDQVWLSMVDDAIFDDAHFYLSGFLLHIQFEYLANNFRNAH